MKTLEVLEKVLRGKRIKDATKRHYREALTSLSKYSEDWPVGGVMINEWLNTLTDRADTSVRMWFDIVKAAGKYVEKAYKLPNPCMEAEVPRVSKKKRRYFSPNEIMQILGACKFGYDRELILTLIDSSCRIGELVNLKGSDVGEGFIKVSGKTGERRYRLNLKVCEELKALAGSADGLVFKGRNGEGLNTYNLRERARRIIIRAGLKGSKLGPHTLRHSGASLVAQATGSALAVKALLQHDDIDTSMIYIHDAEDGIQQLNSPLELAMKKSDYGKRNVGIEPKQLTSDFIGGKNEESKALVVVDPEGNIINGEGVVISEEDTLINDMFPEVEVVSIRPLLKNNDLKLIRLAFLEFAKKNKDIGMSLKMRDLMGRITRRGGKVEVADKIISS